MEWYVYFVLGMILGLIWGICVIMYLKKADGVIQYIRKEDEKSYVSLKLNSDDFTVEKKKRLLIDVKRDSRENQGV